jgi:hypothetical protein
MLEIKSPITGELLQVAENDFEYKMTWYQAKNACNDLGNGWRLPTIEELKAMYKQLHKNGQGNFIAECCYWSSTEYDGSDAWYFSFYVGTAGTNIKDYADYVRAVRALPLR